MFSISKPFLASWCNLHFTQTPDADRRSQEQRIRGKFSTLKDDIKRRLYELYKIDFDLFRYEADQYLWCMFRTTYNILILSMIRYNALYCQFHLRSSYLINGFYFTTWEPFWLVASPRIFSGEYLLVLLARTQIIQMRRTRMLVKTTEPAMMPPAM